jgi:hypothetical protein
VTLDENVQDSLREREPAKPCTIAGGDLVVGPSTGDVRSIAEHEMEMVTRGVAGAPPF